MKKRRYNQNKLLNNLLVVAACFLCFTMLLSFSDSFKNLFDSKESVVEQDQLDELPNIEIPEGAHAFKIGNMWTYAYENETWQEWYADSERYNLNIQIIEDTRLCFDSEIEGGGTYYLCTREYDESNVPMASPVNLEDTILFNLEYVFIIG